MKKQFLAAQILIFMGLNATAGGVVGSIPCTHTSEILASAPLQVYLPDGMTEQTVGEASLISRKSKCNTEEYEIIDVDLKLDNEIKPYGIKIKDSITAFENYVSLEFRLKELVNSTETFESSIYSKTKINHFGPIGMLAFTTEKPETLFWIQTQSRIGDLVTAGSNGQSPNDRPLACSLDKAFVSLTKKATGTDGLKKDLQLTAIFRGPLQLCP